MSPELSKQTCGWLRFIWEKALTPDDWSIDGTPHPWWDRTSTAPMCSFPRFDLGETAYVLPILADRTPAWQEVYTKIADELVGRHTSFWAAIDWLTLIGHDPHPDEYPPEWLAFLPPHLQGKYDPPGWTANGVDPWGLQPDPIGSDGNLFFRGFFNLLLSVYRYVGGDEKWEQPFRVAGYREQTFEWSHYRIAEFLNQQWKDQPQGPHCENTKIWPFCVSAAGLGLQLYDQTADSSFHGVCGEWVEFAKKHYVTRNRGGGLASFPLYYDPVDKVACHFPDELTGLAAITVTPYLIPQHREFGEFLYRESVRMLGWDDPSKLLTGITPDPRFLLAGLLAANDLGDATTADRIREEIYRVGEPRWFGDENTSFGWWFNSEEPWPRGQLSALLMVSEASEPGAWSHVFNNDTARDRFREPTVQGVDYPVLGINRARNILDEGVLEVSTFAATPSRKGSPTSFDVTKLPDVEAVEVYLDGYAYPRWRVRGDGAIEIETEVGSHHFRISTRNGAADSLAATKSRTAKAGGLAPSGEVPDSNSAGTVKDRYQPAAPKQCSCC